ncbi:signal peptidase, endoplasmic reticulum-type [Klenkia marina]|uniref:Signal peptidase I n=1 Tax=Klenkia marina TaxID=1960309 RepID=A0A1G4YUR8_9ACTN|nr:signal peptidase I [Klenkia marina]SCX57183.1 signal peptidase, endoplasmic reticulum-type [Klenkia marina]
MTSAVRLARQVLTVVLGTVLLAVTSVALLVALYPRVTDGQALAVLSGSMRPGMEVGAMVFTERVDPATLGPGDVITFVRPGGQGELVTHRVVAVDTTSGSPAFTTRGDANDVDDLDPVPAASVVGAPRWVVPELGRWASVVHSPKGFGALVLLTCAVIALSPGRRPVEPDPVEEPALTEPARLRLV